ncbi:MAG TPA: hypothetical protein VGC45_10350 [Gryllotalpicola sp.]
MTQRADRLAGAAAVLLGGAATVVLVLGGLEFGVLLYVLAAICVAAVLTRFDAALTWCVVVVFGSIFLFQVDTIPIGLKAAFIGLSGILAVWAAASIARRMPALPARVRGGVKLALWAVGVIAAFLLWQLFTLLWNQVSIGSWLRDSLNYLLVPMVVLIGVEAGFRLSPRIVSALTLLAGLIGAYSYTVAWLGRRSLEQDAYQQFGLASSFVVFAALALCLARFSSGRLRSIGWLVGALALMGIMVVAGGRQTIVQCALALLVAVSIGSGGMVAKSARVVAGLALAAVAFVVTLNVSSTSADGVAVGRLEFFQRLQSNGLAAIYADQSAQARLRALNWLIQQWQQKPLLGWGFGHDMISVNTGQVATNVFTLDSPLVPLEKFGIVGTAVLVVALVLFFAALWRIAGVPGGSRAGGSGVPGSRSVPGGPGRSAFGRVFCAVATVLTLVTLVNGFPPENRGFPVFMLLLALAVVANTTAQGRGGGPAPDGRLRAAETAETSEPTAPVLR